MSQRHRDLQFIHKFCNWEHPDEATRLAESVLPEDIGKAAWQQDDDTFWALKNDDPIEWVQIGASGGGGGSGSDQWKRHYQEKLAADGQFVIPTLPSNYRNVRITVYAASTSPAGDNADVLQLFPIIGAWQVEVVNWDGTNSFANDLNFLEIARLRSPFPDASMTVFEIFGYNNNGDASAAKMFKADNLVVLSGSSVERRNYWGILNDGGPITDITVQARDAVSNLLVAGSTIVVELSGKTD